MQFRMARWSAGWIGAALAALATIPAQAQSDWPNRAITLIVPFAAGGGVDASARLQAIVLGEILGQTIVIENLGAAGGTAGSAKVMKSNPDGYTFLIGNTGTHSFSQAIYKKPPYDAVKDFAPVGLVTESPRILVARKDLPVNNLKEFVAYAKANAAKMQYGSAGVGAGTHLPCALLTGVIGAEITHVPYRGEGPALQDVIAGRMDFMCTTVQSGVVQIRDGSVKGLAVLAPKRLAALPNLPTSGEGGLPNVEATVWNGYFFPKGTPEPIVKKMSDAVNKMLSRPDIQTKMADLGLEIVPPEQRTPEYVTKMLPEEAARWSKVTKDAGISIE